MASRAFEFHVKFISPKLLNHVNHRRYKPELSKRSDTVSFNSTYSNCVAFCNMYNSVKFNHRFFAVSTIVFCTQNQKRLFIPLVYFFSVKQSCVFKVTY